MYTFALYSTLLPEYILLMVTIYMRRATQGLKIPCTSGISLKSAQILAHFSRQNPNRLPRRHNLPQESSASNSKDERPVEAILSSWDSPTENRQSCR